MEPEATDERALEATSEVGRTGKHRCAKQGHDRPAQPKHRSHAITSASSRPCPMHRAPVRDRAPRMHRTPGKGRAKYRLAWMENTRIRRPTHIERRPRGSTSFARREPLTSIEKSQPKHRLQRSERAP